MKYLQSLKIALLICILAEEIKRAIEINSRISVRTNNDRSIYSDLDIIEKVKDYRVL